MKQPQVIKRTIELLNLQYSNPRATPVVNPFLNKNNNGEDRLEDFHYILAFESLSHLAGYARPDVSMPVHQSSKFRTNPNHFHDNSLK